MFRTELFADDFALTRRSAARGETTNVLRGIAALAIAAPRRIIAVALLVMVATAVFGLPVTKNLSAGGFHDPSSESWQAWQLLSDKFDRGDMQLLIAVTSDMGADSLFPTDLLK